MRRTFSALAMSVVFFFLAGPVRVLPPGAPVVIYTTSPELRGTPAAPEPLGSPGHLYHAQLWTIEEGMSDLSMEATVRVAI
jgi:hypothetical protein